MYNTILTICKSGKAGCLIILLCFSHGLLNPIALAGQNQPHGNLRVGHYHTEEQAADLLETFRKSYPDLDLWQIKAEKIRSGILNGAGLYPFPEKTPFNTIRSNRREFDGYVVENVAFESLPGVFVTGSLYYPQDFSGPVPGILSFHGHWNSPEDYGRFREDAQKRCAALAAPRPMLMVSCGGDWTKNTPMVEFPHVQYIYELFSRVSYFKNVHFPDERHGFGFSKRKAVYPFLARYLNLDILQIMDDNGNITEEGIEVEPFDAFRIFSKDHPPPPHTVKSNELVLWN